MKHHSGYAPPEITASFKLLGVTCKKGRLSSLLLVFIQLNAPLD